MTAVLETDRLPLSRSSISYRVLMEPSLIAFGGPRALLLQVLHPSVAAGVEEHSDYQRQPWKRLYRTLDTVFKMAFGKPSTSAERAAFLRRRHAEVTGSRPDGVRYRALDPTLLLWVWATLVDTALLVYEQAVRPLPPADRDAFYEQQKLVAYACGVPEGRCPQTWDDFRAYVDTTIATDLRVTETTRGVVRSITRLPLPPPLDRLGGSTVSAFTGVLLPAPFADELGLPHGGAAHRLVDRWFGLSRLVARRTPPALRRLPVLPLIAI
jgi:uncharacterized protein (DUF2236 family)